jgi:hypothetical protein
LAKKAQEKDEEVMNNEDPDEEVEAGDLGEEMDDGEGTGDPMTCLVTFKKIITDILDDNSLS